MSAVGNYITIIRDRLVALHEADTAWKGAAAFDRDKVRDLNIVVRAGAGRQNFKRRPDTPLQPGDLPSADFMFRSLSPGQSAANPWGGLRTFGLAAGTPTPGLVSHVLNYRVRYKALREDVPAALLCASEVLLARAGAKLANAGASLAALPYCGGAGVTTANADERDEGGVLVYVLDCDVAVAVVLNVAADLLGT